MEFAPEYQEAQRNKRERKEHQREMSRDVLMYNLIQQELSEASRAARATLAEKYPHTLELVDKLNDLDQDVSFEAATKMGALAKTNKNQYELIIKASLEQYFREVNPLLIDYVSSVHKSEHYQKTSRRESTLESMTKQEQLDENRRQKHNALIVQLKMLIRNCKKVGIDTSWQNVVGFSEGIEDRVAVQHWAEHVADYLATRSQTTK